MGWNNGKIKNNRKEQQQMSKAVTVWLSDETIKTLEEVSNRTKLKKSFIVEQGIKKMNEVLKNEIYLSD